MHLGLDLRGGVHFLMQVDMATALNKQLDRRTGDVRSAMRDAKVPLAGVTREGQALVVKFRDADTKTAGSEILRKEMRDFTIISLDDTRLSMTPTPESLKKFADTALQQNVLTLRNRINELGVAEPIIQQQGDDRVVVELPVCRTQGKPRKSSAAPPAWKFAWSTRKIPMPPISRRRCGASCRPAMNFI